jgi:hypothetical protein
MARDRTSEAADDQGHTPAWVKDQDKPVSICVRCQGEFPARTSKYIVCQYCEEQRMKEMQASNPPSVLVNGELVLTADDTAKPIYHPTVDRAKTLREMVRLSKVDQFGAMSSMAMRAGYSGEEIKAAILEVHPGFGADAQP